MAASFESIRTIGAAQDGFDEFVLVTGLCAGLLMGIPAVVFERSMSRSTRWTMLLWATCGLLMGWIVLAGLENAARVSVARENLLVQGTNASWLNIEADRAVRIDGPAHPPGCGGVARTPELEPGLSTDVHVAISICSGAQRILTSTDGLDWVQAGEVERVYRTPRTVVGDGSLVAVMPPPIWVNGRRAQLDTWVQIDDGRLLVLASDPGHRTGFFCC